MYTAKEVKMCELHAELLPGPHSENVDKILEGYSGKKEKTHCVMEPSCGCICNPAIVWLDEFAVVKILDRIKIKKTHRMSKV